MRGGFVKKNGREKDIVADFDFFNSAGYDASGYCSRRNKRG